MYSYLDFKPLLDMMKDEGPQNFVEYLLYFDKEFALRLYHELSKEYT